MRLLPNVKKFYMAVFGLLIMSRSLEDFREILRSMMIVSMCEKDGNVTSSNQPTMCKFYKNKLLQMITKIPGDLLSEEALTEETGEYKTFTYTYI